MDQQHTRIKLLLFQWKSSYANAPHCCVTCTTVVFNAVACVKPYLVSLIKCDITVIFEMKVLIAG